MLKNLYDRLTYAVIGFFFGAVLGALLWFLYDAGFSAWIGAPQIDLGLRAWIKYAGGVFALLGFLLKADAGHVAGSTVDAVYRLERHDYIGGQVPTWGTVLFVLAGIVAVYVLVQRGVL